MPVKNKKTVAIIGFGLLGTSLGLALKGKKYVRIGWSRRPESRKQALKNNVVDKIFENPEDAVSNADITVICLPIPMIMEFCAKFAKSWKKGAIVTDVGSAKEKIIKAVSPILSRNGVHFIGSHPMAGSEQSGAEAAKADLYVRAMVFLTPSPETPAKVVKEISDMWKSAGARIMEIDSVKHDITVAHTSHVPHIVASILTLTALKDGKTRSQRENGCAGGFRDTTRIASSAPQMWREIIENNRAAVLKTLFEFEKNLKSFRENISKAEYSELEKKLRSAKDLRDSWLSKKN